jgi:1-acyl-sn-glycerol-3-phosphate acyltransferase
VRQIVQRRERWWERIGESFGQAFERVERLSAGASGDDLERKVQLLRDRYSGDDADPFGLDPEAARRAALLLGLLYRRYFRTEVHGLNNIGPGRALLVANHSGQVPIDAAILALALFFELEPPRLVRTMVERWMQTLPFVAPWIARLGQVVGLPENCQRLLDRGELILVFPEGVRGIAKPYSRRYQLETFGLGFMRLAVATRTPVIPVAVIGAEEQYISLGNVEWAARALRMPALPLLPQLLVPGGLLPLPTKYRIHFGEPLRFEGDPDDDKQIASNTWLVRQTVQALIRRGLEQRRHVFF